MIRRRVENEFWLITQHDHALLSGEMAQYFGNDRFSPPDPTSSALLGIALHDCGWVIHDDCPTLNKDRLPLDVFETSPQLGFNVWTESARRANDQDPYAGLLVSMHSLSLSVLATSQVFDNHQFDQNDARVRFEINKFQHAQIELQENLRKTLGLHTDQPLHLGIAKDSSDSEEQKLAFNFRLLQAMDKLSLCICCTNSPFAGIEPMLDRPNGQSTPLQVFRPHPQKTIVQPWPFDVDQIELSIPYRRVSAEPFADEASFRQTYLAAPVEQFGCIVAPR